MSDARGIVEFELLDVKRAAGTEMLVLGRSAARTLQGRLEGTAFARARPAALLYVLLVSLGELAYLYGGGRLGVLAHATVFLILVTHASLLRGLHPPLARLLLALAPVPLIRIASLVSPLATFSYIHWFTVLSVVLYAGLLASLRAVGADLASVGLRLPARRDLPLEAAVVLAGFGFGFVEYHILAPGALIPHLSVRQVLAPILIIYVATGLLEELLFRGVVQRYASEAVGPWLAIALGTTLFAVLHSGWNSWVDLLFVGAVGGLYALVVRRTGSIVGVSISHGVTNVMLFLVMPLVAA